MGVLAGCMSVYRVNAWYPLRPERGNGILCNWSYRQLQTARWVLGLKPTHILQKSS